MMKSLATRSFRKTATHALIGAILAGAALHSWADDDGSMSHAEKKAAIAQQKADQKSRAAQSKADKEKIDAQQKAEEKRSDAEIDATRKK